MHGKMEINASHNRSGSWNWNTATQNEKSNSLEQSDGRRCTLLPSQLLSLVKGLDRASQMKREPGKDGVKIYGSNGESSENPESNRDADGNFPKCTSAAVKSTDVVPKHMSEEDFEAESEQERIPSSSSKSKKRRIQILHPILGTSTANGEADLTSIPPRQNLESVEVKGNTHKEPGDESSHSTVNSDERSNFDINDKTTLERTGESAAILNKSIDNDFNGGSLKKEFKREQNYHKPTTARTPKNIELLIYDEPNNPSQDLTDAAQGKSTEVDDRTAIVTVEGVKNATTTTASKKPQTMELNDIRKRKKKEIVQMSKRQRLDTRELILSYPKNGVAMGNPPQDTDIERDDSKDNTAESYNTITIKKSGRMKKSGTTVCPGDDKTVDYGSLANGVALPTVELCFLPYDDPRTIEMISVFPPRQPDSKTDPPPQQYPRNLFYKVDGQITMPVITMEEFRTVVLPLLSSKNDLGSASNQQVIGALNSQFQSLNSSKPTSKITRKTRAPVPKDQNDVSSTAKPKSNHFSSKDKKLLSALDLTITQNSSNPIVKVKRKRRSQPQEVTVKQEKCTTNETESVGVLETNISQSTSNPTDPQPLKTRPRRQPSKISVKQEVSATTKLETDKESSLNLQVKTAEITSNSIDKVKRRPRRRPNKISVKQEEVIAPSNFSKEAESLIALNMSTNQNTSNSMDPVKKKPPREQSKITGKEEVSSTKYKKDEEFFPSSDTVVYKKNSRLSRKRQRKVPLVLEISDGNSADISILKKKTIKKTDRDRDRKPTIDTTTCTITAESNDRKKTAKRSRLLDERDNISTTAISLLKNTQGSSKVNQNSNTPFDISISKTPLKPNDEKTKISSHPEPQIFPEGEEISVSTRSRKNLNLKSNQDVLKTSTHPSAVTLPVQENVQREKTVTTRRRPSKVPEKPDAKPIVSRPSRSHPCYKCSLSFQTSSELAAHVTTHTEEKSFSCSFCEARFTRRGNLVNHLIERHSSCNIKKEKPE